MMYRFPVLPLVLSVVCTSGAAQYPYSRYESVVERQMFGALPRGFDPTKRPDTTKPNKREAQELTQEQEKVKKAIRFTVLNVAPDGVTWVGFSDNGDPKNPVHYYLPVGETSQNGNWTVKEADPDAATMTIVKASEDIEVTLKLGGDSATNADAVSRTAKEQPAVSTLLGGGRSLRDRRRLAAEQQRLAEEKRAEEDRARAQREERSAAIQSQLLGEIQKLKEENRKAREEVSAPTPPAAPPADEASAPAVEDSIQ